VFLGAQRYALDSIFQIKIKTLLFLLSPFNLANYLAAMFTGIVENTGKIISIEKKGTNASFWIESLLSGELKVDQSLSHDGVCLTVEAIEGNKHRVTAIEETLKKTNIASWSEGNLVNLERCMLMNGRLDGHIVQGHVDAIATCSEFKVLDGSWEYRFEFPNGFGHLVIEKGSIAVNGTSVTCFNVTKNHFSIAIIPYTFEHTSIKKVQINSTVNIEFDILGKYVQRWMQLKN
jgi:riboflavin synthase